MNRGLRHSGCSTRWCRLGSTNLLSGTQLVVGSAATMVREATSSTMLLKRPSQASSYMANMRRSKSLETKVHARVKPRPRLQHRRHPPPQPQHGNHQTPPLQEVRPVMISRYTSASARLSYAMKRSAQLQGLGSSGPKPVCLQTAPRWHAPA